MLGFCHCLNRLCDAGDRIGQRNSQIQPCSCGSPSLQCERSRLPRRPSGPRRRCRIVMPYRAARISKLPCSMSENRIRQKLADDRSRPKSPVEPEGSARRNRLEPSCSPSRRARRSLSLRSWSSNSSRRLCVRDCTVRIGRPKPTRSVGPTPKMPIRSALRSLACSPGQTVHSQRGLASAVRTLARCSLATLSETGRVAI